MTRIDCGGRWLLRLGESGEELAAEVPGSVYSALLAAGKLEDPFYRDNETKALALMEQDFTYTRKILADEKFVAGRVQRLRCEGIDTIADIYLNDSLLGHCENMHRTWEFDVAGILRAGENTLRVELSSPTRYIREQQKLCYTDGSTDAMEGFPHIRKAHCMYGWDWGPRLPDAGIWRRMELLSSDTGRLPTVYVSQKHSPGLVELSFFPETADAAPGAQLRFETVVTGPDGRVFRSENAEEIKIPDPLLWWPHGYGEQPLYTVEVTMWENGEPADRWKRRIGLRTLTVRREKDAWGESFATEVNGVQIFAMGGDYIPEDNILSRVNPERTRRLLLDCVEANFNAVRVWGGGYYPDDFFFDLCDELGLVVWQDFMTACAMIELTDDFEENLTAEYTENIKRLRHHACLGVWCGNNEMEWQVDHRDWNYTAKQKSDYVIIYEHILPKLMKTYAPQSFYWPSSPSSGGGFDSPNDFNRGDVHYWEVWHGNKPFPDYRNHFFRYASEFGFQSFPCLKTVEAFTEPRDRNIFSYVMEKHQRNQSANGKILTYLSSMYLYPARFDTLLYASQLLQAEAIKYGVEHWRRNRGRCMGAIYWQLNDCWPVASWASIDYYGRWKALHYYAKRFFAPVMLSCCEEGVLTQNTNVNAEPYPLKKSARLSVANETMEGFDGRVRWSLRDADSNVLRHGEWEIHADSLSSVWLPELCFEDAELYQNYLRYTLLKGEEEISGGTVLFCPPKHFEFHDPKLRLQADGDSITVYAGAYAKSVEIESEDTDMVLSDNYFDMDKGSVTVKVLRGKPGKLSVRSVYDIR